MMVLAETADQMAYKTRLILAFLLRQSLLATMDQEKTTSGDEYPHKSKKAKRLAKDWPCDQHRNRRHKILQR